MDVEQDVGDLKTGLASAATKTELANGLNGKVDKESGKGLSTNDYTTADKNKLAGLSNLKSRVITAGTTDETHTVTADNGRYLIFCIAHPQLLSTVSVLDATRYGQTGNEYGLNVVSGVIKLKVKAYGQCIVFWNDNKELTITKD